MAGGHRGRGSVRGRECEIGGGRVDRNLFLLCDGGTLVHFLAEKAEKEKKNSSSGDRHWHIFSCDVLPVVVKAGEGRE